MAILNSKLADGEAILTEYSHKYTLEGFARMAHDAGFEVEKVWTDPEKLFSVQYCVRACRGGRGEARSYS